MLDAMFKQKKPCLFRTSSKGGISSFGKRGLYLHLHDKDILQIVIKVAIEACEILLGPVSASA